MMRPEKRSRSERGFTLIELLVVVSIITLLMALLFPALSRARKQARAVACQGHLHQWGLTLAMCLLDNDGYFPYGPEWGDPPTWLESLEPYFTGSPKVLLCPSAVKRPPDGMVAGNTFVAYTWGRDGYGSYGINGWLGLRGACFLPPSKLPVRYWGPVNVKEAANIPALFDCATSTAGMQDWVGPPAYEGYHRDEPISEFCMNRHNGGINMLFSDSSLRKVGLKELWTLNWHREYDPTGPWTKAGGVLPSDWPKWMRKFKDY